jgi:hypothetical protein
MEHNSIEVTKQNRRGITPLVKDTIDEILYNYDCRPKRILVRLHSFTQSEKNKHKVDILPTLLQVQCHIKCLRAANGNVNGLDEFKEYAEELYYDKS